MKTAENIPLKGLKPAAQKPVDQLADELSDAYSTTRYKNGWRASIKMLRRRGYDDRQIEAIIRSKWTRWAADGSNNRYGHHTSADLARFLDSHTNTSLKAAVAELAAQTFSEVK